MARGKKQEEEVVTEEILEQAQAEMTPKVEPEKPQSRSSAFEKVLNDFSENEGWVHIKLKKDNQAPVKIGKFRPNEFDKDEIARQYGGGVYYYDLRDKEGKRVATDEERYADNLLSQKGAVQDTGLNQALDLIKQLAGEIAKVKQEIAKPQVIQPPQEDKRTDLILEMIKQQNQQSLEMMKAIAQMNKPVETKQNSIDDVLKMITVVKGLMPEPPKPVEQEKPSMAEAVELASVLSDLKDNGGQVNNQSLVDIVKTFLTDGSLGNIIAMLKQKPIVPPPQVPQTQVQKPQIPQATQISEEDKANGIMIDFFKQYEKTLFDMKVNGSNSSDVGNTICELTNLQPEFKTIAYIFFNDINKATDKLMSVTQLFKQDKQFIYEVCQYIHSFFYDINDEDTEIDNTEDLIHQQPELEQTIQQEQNNG